MVSVDIGRNDRFFLRGQVFPFKTDEKGVHIKVFDDEEENAWLTISPFLLEWLSRDVNGTRTD